MRRPYLILLVLVAGFVAASVPGLAVQSEVPGLVDLSRIKIEIVRATFHEALTGLNANFKTEEPHKFRAVRVTLKITKPAGTPIEIRGSDLVLHYRRTSGFDIAGCKGLSLFSTAIDDDRPLFFGREGSITASSPAESKVGAATEVYVDAVFLGMEPDTTVIHLLVAQPISAQWTTAGWK